MTRGGVLLRFIAALAAAVLVVRAAGAQDYPSRAITLVVPFAVGSGIDPTARIIGDELSRALKRRSCSTTNPEPTARLRRARSRVRHPMATPFL